MRRSRHVAATVLLSLVMAMTMAIPPVHATSAASAADDSGSVGGPLAKVRPDDKVDPRADPKMDPHYDPKNDPRQRWPFADVTVPPRPLNGSNRDDEETVPSTCSYYARSSKGCSRPRTCRDCLEMNDCMVNQFGACINMTIRGFEPSMDYHQAFKFNLTGSGASERNLTLRYHFPATNATYCPVDDAACLECKRTVFAGDVSDSRFCVGQNNCICIASCEATGWEQLAGGMRCGPPPRFKALAADGPPRWNPDDRDKSKEKDKATETGGVSWQQIWTMGGIPALVVVVGILVVRSNRLETKRRNEATRLQQLQLQQQLGLGEEDPSNGSSRGGEAGETAVTSSRRLNLAGWQASRREPNKKKDCLLECAQDVSPKHHFVDLLNTRPSVNPQVTILAAPVLGAVFIEASAPPMSPQHHEEGMEPPSAPSFDSDFEYEHEPTDTSGMGLKRVRPMAVVPVPSPTTVRPPVLSASSSSSSSGAGAFNLDAMVPYNGYGSEPLVAFDGSDASDGSSASGSRADTHATITALDLLPKELRRIANTTRPDSDIPWTSDDDTCYYYQMDDDKCFHPRTCRDCLERPGCMINQLGQCVDQSIDRYNGFMDFRVAITKNLGGPLAKNPNASHTQQYHFPAKSVSYCPADEPTCRYCRRNDFKYKIDSRFCIGAFNNRKCICISICESPVRSEVLVHQNCTNPLSTSTLAKGQLGHPLMSTPSLFTVIVAPIVLVLVAYQIVQRHRRTRTASQDAAFAGMGVPRSGDADGGRDAADSVWSWSTATAAFEMQQPPERAVPSGRLDLSGWQALRQEMIAKEQLLLANLEAASPASGWVDFDDLDDGGDDVDGDSWRSLSVPMDDTVATGGVDETTIRPRDSSISSPSIRTTSQADHIYWNESDLAIL